MLCHAVRREIHESCSGSGEKQNSRFASTCIGASFSRFFALAVDIFACAHFRTSLLARATAHSRDVCRTCESKALRRQFHDRSHVFFVVILHQFSKSCYFSSQKHGFRSLAPCVALNLGIAVATWEAHASCNEAKLYVYLSLRAPAHLLVALAGLGGAPRGKIL